MQRNGISLAMLAAFSASGVLQIAAHAQGGVLIPETATTPVFNAGPNGVEHPAHKVEPKQTAMPVTNAAKPIKATGRIVRTQKVQSYGYQPGERSSAMLMGGFRVRLLDDEPVVMYGGLAPKLATPGVSTPSGSASGVAAPMLVAPNR